jgi:hypothetical protein
MEEDVPRKGVASFVHVFQASLRDAGILNELTRR